MKIKRLYSLIFALLFIALSSSIILGEELTVQKETYTIGYHTDQSPMQYIDGSQVSTGISIDLIKYVSEKSNIDFQFFPIINGTNINHINTLDFSILNVNNAIDKSVFTRTTEPYYALDLFLVGSVFGTENTGKKVGIINHYGINDMDILEVVPNATVHYFNDSRELQKSLINGGIDYAFMNSISYQDFSKSDNGHKFKKYQASISIPWVVQISDNMPDGIEDIFNEIFQNIDQSTLTSIVLENTPNVLGNSSFLNERNSYDYITAVRTGALIVIGIAIILYFISYLYRSNLDKVTFYDKVTGFLTEYKFNVEVTKVLKKARKDQYSLVSIDIDNFQYVNEVYGFDTGTNILQQFGDFLEKYYPNGKFFTRVHSDNFLILVENDKSIDDWEKIDFSDENFDDILGNYCHFYTSKGIYNIHNPSMPLTTIVGCVNLARVSGKTTYGNTSITFTDEMNKKHLAQNKILGTMEKALKEKEFEVYYQPKVSLDNQTTCGAEALVRWIVREGDPIFPDEFIPLFEKNRYITKLDLYVFEEVCYFISTHRAKLKDIVISVNLSTITLLQNDLIENLQRLLTEYDVNVSCVELEITESAFVDNLEQVLLQIQLLKNIGFSIALDDFGSGISSLNQLKNIDLDVLKLDKAFLSNSLNQDKGILIVENVILLAQKLNLTIVAEGVETEADVSLLSNLGCDIAQGYFYARPMPRNNLLNFLETPLVPIKS